MNKRFLQFVIAGSILGFLIYNRQKVVDTVTAAIAGWKNVGSGPQWVPYINDVENQYGLPLDMLAAIAYRESYHFRESVIRGTEPSSDGLSLGIVQLRTLYYPSLVGPGVPVPYTDQNVMDQINTAAQVLAANYSALGTWPATIASFNQGLQGVKTHGITSTAYVAEVLGNAPAANV
jgi:hypothetical protein